MKYTTPKLHSFGHDVKHGDTCGNGSAVTSESGLNNCNTGGSATAGCACGSQPGKASCSTGNATKGNYCNTGNGFKSTSHH
jgi:hypothetical protein